MLTTLYRNTTNDSRGISIDGNRSTCSRDCHGGISIERSEHRISFRYANRMHYRGYHVIGEQGLQARLACLALQEFRRRCVQGSKGSICGSKHW